MKFFYILGVIFAFLAANISASSFIYTDGEASLSLPKKDVILYNGVPVKILSQKSKSAVIKIEGYVKKGDNTKLFATKNLSLLLVSVENKKNLISISKDKGSITLNVPKEILSDDQDEAWEAGSDLFYDRCTKCHHAKIIKKHAMLEWEAIFSSMKQKAKTTTAQNELIIRFLKAFAKDGILTQSD